MAKYKVLSRQRCQGSHRSAVSPLERGGGRGRETWQINGPLMPCLFPTLDRREDRYGETASRKTKCCRTKYAISIAQIVRARTIRVLRYCSHWTLAAPQATVAHSLLIALGVGLLWDSNQSPWSTLRVVIPSLCTDTRTKESTRRIRLRRAPRNSVWIPRVCVS